MMETCPWSRTMELNPQLGEAEQNLETRVVSEMLKALVQLIESGALQAPRVISFRVSSDSNFFVAEGTA